MLVRTMHVVAENMGPLEVMIMCSHPSKHPFTLVVRPSDGIAVGKQMNELYEGMQVATYVCTYVSYILVCACIMHGLNVSLNM